jgi:membrane-associated phospholipid phosphatase
MAGSVTARSGMRAALAALSCVVLVGLSIAFADRPIADWVHAHYHKPEWAKLLTQFAVVPDPLALLALLVVGILYLRLGYNTEARRTALMAALATILATMLVILLKYAFGRLWPETWVDNNPSWIANHAYGFQPFHGGRGNESFPSGHTTRITAPFAVLWQRLPRYRVLWVLPTIAVMAGLIFCNFHFLSDCIAGVYLGVASAAIMLVLL